jgi:hypothetical protein
MMLVSSVVFTIILMVKEVIILQSFSQVGGGPFPSPFLGGVVRGTQGGMRCVGGHKTQEQHMGDLPISTLDIDRRWSATSLTFA